MNSSPDIKIFLIGNKADLEDKRLINKKDAEKYKEDYDLDYFIETSAKTGMNAQEIFVEAARTLYKDYSLYVNEKKNKENINNGKDEKKKNTKNNKVNLYQNIDKTKKKNCCQYYILFRYIFFSRNLLWNLN